MKGSRFAAAALFALLAALALPFGLPRGVGQGWKALEGELASLREGMTSGALLHLPVEIPPFPPSSSFCAGCHPLPPHEGEGPGRAFLNDHASLFDCLVCHWAKASGQRPDPVWKADGKLRLEGDESRDLAALRAAVTGGQRCFDRGASCSGCHRAGGIDRYSKGELSPQRRAALESLPDFLVVSKGAKWYFPQRIPATAP